MTDFFSISPLTAPDLTKIWTDLDVDLAHVTDMIISNAQSLESQNYDAHSITYIDSKKLKDKVHNISAGYVLTTKTVADALANDDRNIHAKIIIVDAPKFRFCQLVEYMVQSKSDLDWAYISQDALPKGCHQSAVISTTAKIGDGVIIGAGVVIGPDCEIGDHTIIHPNTTITHAKIGAHCDIRPNTQIGAAGFGYIPTPNGLYPVPQIGHVILKNNVRVGANVCIDRGALSNTIIGARTKIDNLVQIAHNVTIGEDCVFAAQTGIAGSATIGNRVMVGGQCGITEHVVIENDCKIMGATGVFQDVPAGSSIAGRPPRPTREWLREQAWLKKQIAKK